MIAAEHPVVVVGIGQEAAGDDAVGLLVARVLAARGVAAIESSDASVLVELFSERRKVVVVDAVVGGGTVGAVRRLRPEALARGPLSTSSHGLGVADAIALATALYDVEPRSALAIVGVVVREPRLGEKLSPAVAAAVERAARFAARLARRLGAPAIL